MSELSVQLAHVRGLYREAMERIADLEAHDAPAWLPELCAALGWSGGTIHQALSAVRRLVEAPNSDGARYALQVQLDEVARVLGPARMEAAGGFHYEAVAQIVREVTELADSTCEMLVARVGPADPDKGYQRTEREELCGRPATHVFLGKRACADCWAWWSNGEEPGA